MYWVFDFKDVLSAVFPRLIVVPALLGDPTSWAGLE
jgi:hypothetical protein